MAQMPSEALEWGRRQLQSSGGTRLQEADVADLGKAIGPLGPLSYLLAQYVSVPRSHN